MKNRMLKLLVSYMMLVFFVNGTLPIVSVADEYQSDNSAVESTDESTSRPRVVVSMGDSYSSGEGLEDYYGSSDPDSGDKFIEFLAHQSKNSWPGMLELPEVGKMSEHKARSFPDYSYDPNAKLQWYFVASSGAETKDILGYNKKTNGKTLKNVGQEKEYSIAKDSANIKAEVRSAYFNPQISVLEYLKKQGVVPDYITLTIGGNDLGFADIISEACMENRYYTFFLTNNLNKKLNEAQNKLDNGTKKEKSVRDKLRATYKAINDVFKDDNKKPCILVAGYPRLLDPNGKGLLIEKNEATQINEKVTYFNDAIAEVVKKARDQDGINIKYIDVETAFGTDHGAYSKNAWINEVVLIPRESDINKAIYIKRKENWLNIASAQSMHPNKDGAKCYAECFQKVINKKEKVTTKEALTPTPKPIEIKVLSDEQALKAIKNYINIELGYAQYTGEAPWSVDIDKTKTSSDTAVVYFRAYTGSHSYYYVDRISGETYEKVYTPDMEPGVGEGKNGAAFNAWDYLNRAPSSTETSKDTTEPSQSDETTFPSETTTATKPVGKTKVTTIKKTYKNEWEGGKSTVRIPKLTIDGVNTNSINNEMSKTIINACTDKIDGKKYYRDARFSYYIGKTYVSIIVHIDPFASDPIKYVFNISRRTGKKMSRNEMLKALGITSKKFESRTLKAIKKVWKPVRKEKWFKNDKEAQSAYKHAISSKLLKKAVPCVDSKGKLCCYIKQMPVPGASGYEDSVCVI